VGGAVYLQIYLSQYVGGAGPDQSLSLLHLALA